MTTGETQSPSGTGASPDMASTLAGQRREFLKAGVPDLRARKASLKRLRAGILAHRKDLNEAVSADFGHRSHYETEIMETVVTIQAIDYLLRNTGRFMKSERRRVEVAYKSGRAYIEYQPKGIVGIMAPWNYPFSLTMIPLATALAAGNRAMLKPSEFTPRTSGLIRRLLAEVFAPEEVAVVLGGAEIGAAFSALPFDHLLFTGSTKVGRLVMKAASANLVPLTLELGGKSPAIIGRGEVTAEAVKSLVFGKLSNAGQTCIAPDYVMVHGDDLDRFVELYDETVRHAYPDGPTGKDYSSIVSDGQIGRAHV